MDLIRGARTTLVFINTRAQAELFFQALWAVNDEGLPIGLHHGSLSREARARVEAAMVAGRACGPSSRPARSTSASTGATSTW